ncbi:MAG: hypothetical protein LBG06_06800, partial [Deltaproteobacteria bacterium]|nr:hypothetical protein [Deltaproteobacteria bacterium]
SPQGGDTNREYLSGADRRLFLRHFGVDPGLVEGSGPPDAEPPRPGPVFRPGDGPVQITGSQPSGADGLDIVQFPEYA